MHPVSSFGNLSSVKEKPVPCVMVCKVRGGVVIAGGSGAVESCSCFKSFFCVCFFFHCGFLLVSAGHRSADCEIKFLSCPSSYVSSVSFLLCFVSSFLSLLFVLLSIFFLSFLHTPDVWKRLTVIVWYDRLSMWYNDYRWYVFDSYE